MPSLDDTAKVVGIIAALIAMSWAALQLYGKILQGEFIRRRFSFDLGMSKAKLQLDRKFRRFPLRSLFFFIHEHSDKGIIFMLPFSVQSTTGYKNNIVARFEYPQR